jgi:steroid 5-alpha reductase family enzyme
MNKSRALWLVLLVYVLAGAAAVGTGLLFQTQQPIVIVGLADLAATIVVFIFSMLTKNSSMYDPYWSVAPVPIALFWLFQPGSNGFANPRHVLIFLVLCAWAIRLTANWGMQWRGLKHEDWRYRDIQKQTGSFYWPVSFLGIHLVPTILVFLGCLALWPALSDGNSQLTWLDILAALVALLAVLIEGTADLQMRSFRNQPDASEQPVPPGLWLLTRHPNYFGEVLFWWGLFLFIPLTYTGFWWAIVGPVGMLLLFLGLSIPLMERHLLAGHPNYKAYQQQVRSPFFPWFPRSKSSETGYQKQQSQG